MRTFPEAHASHTPSALQRSQLAVVPLLGHAKHFVPSALGFFPSVVQAEHVTEGTLAKLAAVLGVHVLQSAMPPFAASLQGVQIFFPSVGVVGK